MIRTGRWDDAKYTSVRGKTVVLTQTNSPLSEKRPPSSNEMTRLWYEENFCFPLDSQEKLRSSMKTFYLSCWRGTLVQHWCWIKSSCFQISLILCLQLNWRIYIFFPSSSVELHRPLQTPGSSWKLVLCFCFCTAMRISNKECAGWSVPDVPDVPSALLTN